jgi:hypothetical protein
MYRNESSGGSGNGHRITRLTDLGVEMVDTPAGSETNAHGARREDDQKRGDVRVAGEQERRPLITEEDEPAGVEMLADNRGRWKRLALAAGIVITLLALLVGAGYFWLSGASRDHMAYRVKTPPAPTDSTTAGGQGQGITVEEIARELRKPEAGSGSAAGQNADNNRAVAPDASPVTDLSPGEDYSTTVNAQQPAAASTAPSVTNLPASSSAGVQPAAASDAESAAKSFVNERSIRVTTLQREQG